MIRLPKQIKSYRRQGETSQSCRLRTLGNSLDTTLSIVKLLVVKTQKTWQLMICQNLMRSRCGRETKGREIRWLRKGELRKVVLMSLLISNKKISFLDSEQGHLLRERTRKRRTKMREETKTLVSEISLTNSTDLRRIRSSSCSLRKL